MCLIIGLVLSGCAGNSSKSEGSYSGSVYTVKRGDTLSRISRMTGTSVGELARLNGISPPYNINVGQKLRVSGSAKSSGSKKSSATQTAKVIPSSAVPQSSWPAVGQRCWRWPATGKVVMRYSTSEGGNKGIDIAGSRGQPVYAAAAGKVVYVGNQLRGYGNLVIIRHDNGLETYYGHLSERMVEPNQWVEAGQIIGLGGSTGRSTGPHLHFETRYYGQSFDPERLIDFKNGLLCRETFLLKKSFFSIYSNAGQDFDDEIANEEQDKKEAAEKAAMKYHRIKSGDTLGAIARKYGTTVTNICRLNGIKSTTTLRIGRSLRVR